jgi:hypothetical protein
VAHTGEMFSDQHPLRVQYCWRHDSAAFAQELEILTPTRTMFATVATKGQRRGVVDIGAAAIPGTVGTLKLVRCRFASAAEPNPDAHVHIPNMTGFLRTTVHLHTLEIQSLRHDEPVPGHFMSALRQNGSLWTVQYEIDLRVQTLAIGRYLNAITTRNQVTRQLLTEVLRENPATGDDCDATSIASNPHHHDHHHHHPRLFVLCPTLFAVAKQAPRMAPNTLLIGLLTSKDGLGPGMSVLGKRKALLTDL